MEIMDLNLNPLLTVVILVVVHFLKMQMANIGTLEPNLMDTQPLTAHMHTAKMATFTLVVGKSSGCKLTWQIWIKECLSNKEAAMATSMEMIGSIQTNQTQMTATIAVMTAIKVVMTATKVVMMAIKAVMTATTAMMATTAMTATTEVVTKLLIKLSKMLN